MAQKRMLKAVWGETRQIGKARSCGPLVPTPQKSEGWFSLSFFSETDGVFCCEKTCTLPNTPSYPGSTKTCLSRTILIAEASFDPPCFSISSYVLDRKSTRLNSSHMS